MELVGITALVLVVVLMVVLCRVRGYIDFLETTKRRNTKWVKRILQ